MCHVQLLALARLVRLNLPHLHRPHFKVVKSLAVDLALVQVILVTIASMAGSVLHLKHRHNLAQMAALAGLVHIVAVDGFAFLSRLEVFVPNLSLIVKLCI